MSKKPFLLLEILIALSLMATLMSLLFSFMVQSMRVEKKMEKARASILERQTLQIRLGDLLTTLSPDAEHPALYTQKFPKEDKESLIAVFDHGVDPDPLFSGLVIGKVYLDEQHQLCLVYWPIEPTKNRPWRKEILFSHVDDFSLQFLGSTPTSKVAWNSSWPKEKGEIPSMIRLTIQQKEVLLQFAFRLPNSYPIATYLGAL